MTWLLLDLAAPPPLLGLRMLPGVPTALLCRNLFAHGALGMQGWCLAAKQPPAPACLSSVPVFGLGLPTGALLGPCAGPIRLLGGIWLVSSGLGLCWQCLEPGQWVGGAGGPSCPTLRCAGSGGLVVLDIAPLDPWGHVVPCGCIGSMGSVSPVLPHARWPAGRVWAL